MNFLVGNRTYIVAGLTIVLLVAHLFGIDIPGVNYTAVPTIGTLVAVFFARQAATNTAAKALAAATALSPDTKTMSVADAKTVVNSAPNKTGL